MNLDTGVPCCLLSLVSWGQRLQRRFHHDESILKSAREIPLYLLVVVET